MIARTPLNIFTLALAVYTIITLVLTFYFEKFFFLLTLTFFILLFTFLANKIGKNLSYINSLISIMILFLIVHPSKNVLEIGLLSLSLIVFRLLRYRNMPIINPTVTSILGVYLLSFLPFIDSPFVSWWGAAYLGSWSLLFLLPVIIYGAYKFRKIVYILAIFITFILIDSLVNGFSSFNILTGTLYFAIGIMFLEIKTSPVLRNDQIIIGILSGIALVGLYKIHFIIYPILTTILFANILVFLKKIY